MSEKRAHAVCAIHGCQLITPKMPPHCPRCRGIAGGGKRTAKQVAAGKKNLRQRWPKA